MTGTLHEDQCTVVVMFDCVLLTMRDVTDTICRENQNTHFFDVLLTVHLSIILVSNQLNLLTPNVNYS